MTCPGCDAANPTDAHLMDEYLDLSKHALGGVFHGNAARARAQVARLLLERGITEIPNPFGAISVRP